MPDKAHDLLKFIAAQIRQLHCQFQRFMTNLHDFHNQTDEDNENPSPETIIKQIEYNDLILNDFHSAIQELSINWQDLNQINERLKKTLPATHTLSDNHLPNF